MHICGYRAELAVLCPTVERKASPGGGGGLRGDEAPSKQGQTNQTADHRNPSAGPTGCSHECSSLPRWSQVLLLNAVSGHGWLRPSRSGGGRQRADSAQQRAAQDLLVTQGLEFGFDFALGGL